MHFEVVCKVSGNQTSHDASGTGMAVQRTPGFNERSKQGKEGVRKLLILE
jgi:hypothetical protein